MTVRVVSVSFLYTSRDSSHQFLLLLLLRLLAQDGPSLPSSFPEQVFCSRRTRLRNSLLLLKRVHLPQSTPFRPSPLSCVFISLYSLGARTFGDTVEHTSLATRGFPSLLLLEEMVILPFSLLSILLKEIFCTLLVKPSSYFRFILVYVVGSIVM